MRWQVRITGSANRNLARLPERLRGEVAELILDLRVEPRPEYSKALGRELQGQRTIRVDGWRVIYTVNDDDQIVIILAIRPRGKNTYLGL